MSSARHARTRRTRAVRVKQSALFAPAARTAKNRSTYALAAGRDARMEHRKPTREIDSSSEEDSSWLLKGMRKGRSSSNTSYREVATQSRSGRHSGKWRDGCQVGHADGAGNRRRQRELMPSAERRTYMTRTEVVKSLRTSEVVKFSGANKDEDAKDFLHILD